MDHITNLETKKPWNPHTDITLIGKLKTHLENLQIHKMSEFDKAQDLEQWMQGQIEVQIRMVPSLQPGSTMNYITRSSFRRQWKDKKGELNIMIQTWTITNLRLHFWTIFKNVSHAMSWKAKVSIRHLYIERSKSEEHLEEKRARC